MGLFNSSSTAIRQIACNSCYKFHTLEDLINTHRGVNASNFNLVVTTINAIGRELSEIDRLLGTMSFNKQINTQIKWTDGRNLSLIDWVGACNWSLIQAKQIVNRYQKIYPEVPNSI